MGTHEELVLPRSTSQNLVKESCGSKRQIVHMDKFWQQLVEQLLGHTLELLA